MLKQNNNSEPCTLVHARDALFNTVYASESGVFYIPVDCGCGARWLNLHTMETYANPDLWVRIARKGEYTLSVGNV